MIAFCLTCYIIVIIDEITVERKVAAERGVQRNTIVYHRNKILDKLRKILENF